MSQKTQPNNSTPSQSTQNAAVHKTQVDQPSRHNKSQLPTIIVSLIFAFALLGVLVVLARGFETKRLSCQSSSGDIIIEYSDQNITGYTASTTLEFDLKGQQEYAERVGLESYLVEFQEWFEEHTDGTCHR